MHKRYVVRLTDDEWGHLEALVHRGRAHARKLLYARVLFKADASEVGPTWTDGGSPMPWRLAPLRRPATAGASARTGRRSR
jgi:hypothetical protein